MTLSLLLQYTDWEHLADGYLNQKKIAEVVGDFFFICPTNQFAEHFAARGTKVYYYFFTQVKPLTRRVPRLNASLRPTLRTECLKQPHSLFTK